MTVSLDASVSFRHQQLIRDHVSAHLSHAVTVGGEPVLPAGSRVSGVVTDAARSGKVKRRRPHRRPLQFNRPGARGREVPNVDLVNQMSAQATKKKDAAKIGAGAAGGALITRHRRRRQKRADWHRHRVAAPGTAVVMSTRGDEVQHQQRIGADRSVCPNRVTIKVRG